ncbi:MAG: LPS export ABC transporter permease LptF [Pseudomonadota bacterium]
MGRVSRQIVRDVLGYAAMMAFIVLALLAVAKVSQYLKRVAYGELPFSAVLSLIGLGLPTLVSTVLPIAIFFGVYLTFNRMYRYNEMTALAAAGVGPSQLLRPAMGAMLLLFGVQIFTSFYWAPQAERAIIQQANHYARLAGLAMMQPGSFNRLPGGRILYLGAPLPSQPDRYQGVFIYENGGDGGRDRAITTAAWGQVSANDEGSLDLILLDGRRYMGTPGVQGFKILAFARYRVHLPPPKLSGQDNGSGRMSAKTNADLLAMLQGPQARAAWAELQWRLGWPALLPLLTLLAIPLAYAPPRGGRAGGILIGVLLLLIFNNLLLLAKSWVVRGQMPVFPGIWWVHLMLLALAGYTFYRRSRGLEWWPLRFMRGWL